MTGKIPANIENALRKAITEAINAMGLDAFKKTSFFMSNTNLVQQVIDDEIRDGLRENAKIAMMVRRAHDVKKSKKS